MAMTSPVLASIRAASRDRYTPCVGSESFGSTTLTVAVAISSGFHSASPQGELFMPTTARAGGAAPGTGTTRPGTLLKSSRKAASDSCLERPLKKKKRRLSPSTARSRRQHLFISPAQGEELFFKRNRRRALILVDRHAHGVNVQVAVELAFVPDQFAAGSKADEAGRRPSIVHHHRLFALCRQFGRGNAGKQAIFRTHNDGRLITEAGQRPVITGQRGAQRRTISRPSVRFPSKRNNVACGPSGVACARTSGVPRTPRR